MKVRDVPYAKPTGQSPTGIPARHLPFVRTYLADGKRSPRRFGMSVRIATVPPNGLGPAVYVAPNSLLGTGSKAGIGLVIVMPGVVVMPGS
jgi:hypothetical protein